MARSPASSPIGRRSPSRGASASGCTRLLIIASADAFAKSIGSIPQIAALIKSIYPDIDLTSHRGCLQLTFFAFGSFILGLAGASFLAGWSSDEGRRPARARPGGTAVPRALGSRAALGVLAAIGS